MGENDLKLIVLIWVDDTLTLHNPKNSKPYEMFLKVFGTKFNIVDMGESKRYVGIDIHRDWEKGTIFLNQSGALEDAAKYYQVEFAKRNTTPMESKLMLYPANEDEESIDKPYRGIVGSLMHPMIWTRPDLAFAVSTLGQFLSRWNWDHWEAALGVLKYANSTRGLSMVYKKQESWDLWGYCDSDWAGDLRSGRSHYGYVFYVGGNVVSWKSKKSHTPATSSTTAELEALYNATLEGIWISEIMHSLGLIENPKFKIFVDNKAVVDVVNSKRVLERLKHEVVKVEFVREKIQSGVCVVELVGTANNPADIFTKSLGRVLFQKHRKDIGLEDTQRDNEMENSSIIAQPGGVLQQGLLAKGLLTNYTKGGDVENVG